MSSADTVPRYRAEDYTVGWLCALPLPELKAAKEMLDCQHARPLNIDENDSNWYEFGDIGQHKVVLASLNAFSPGTLSAQRLIQPLRQTFPNMVFHLFVGIGGGIPRRSATEDALGKRSRPKNALQDIHLGDVVVGWPEKTGAQAVINYDFYRSRGSEQGPELLSGLDKPDPRLVKALTPMISDREERTTNFHNHLRKLTDLEMFAYPGLEKDVLYESECAHSTDTDWVLDLGCRDCDAEMIVNRAERKWPEPQFHFGTILSGNRIVEDSRERDRLSDMYPGALCLEMEAAGVVDDTHCLVIRGISDYADSHRKSLGWHNYAAASAAAFAKEILYTLRPATTKTMKSQDRGTFGCWIAQAVRTPSADYPITR